MKRANFIFSLFMFFSTQAHSYGMIEIIAAINQVAHEEKIAPKVLYTIVQIESGFNPLAISFLTNKENALYFKKLENENIKIVVSNYSLNKSKWVVSIRPNTLRRARAIAKLLIQDGFSVDVGLGQLNSHNFRLSEIEDIFEPIYNLRKCSGVLRSCYKAKKGDMPKTIECYNYGMRDRGANPYYKRFYEHYRRDFGGLGR